MKKKKKKKKQTIVSRTRVLNEESPIEGWLLQTRECLSRPGDVDVDEADSDRPPAEIKKKDEGERGNAREEKSLRILTETEGLPMTGASRRVSPLG